MCSPWLRGNTFQASGALGFCSVLLESHRDSCIKAFEPQKLWAPPGHGVSLGVSWTVPASRLRRRVNVPRGLEPQMAKRILWMWLKSLERGDGLDHHSWLRQSQCLHGQRKWVDAERRGGPVRKEEGWEACSHKLRSASSCLSWTGGWTSTEPPKKAWPCWPFDFCPGMLILDFWPPRLLKIFLKPPRLWLFMTAATGT